MPRKRESIDVGLVSLNTRYKEAYGNDLVKVAKGEITTEMHPREMTMLCPMVGLLAKYNLTTDLLNVWLGIDMKTFDGVIQRCFKDWLSETKNYGWCKKTFTNWSSCNLWSGKAWEEFCESVVRHLEQPDGIVAKPIQTASDFFKSKVDELTEKGLKTGVWNDNFEALKAVKREELQTLLKKKENFENLTKETEELKRASDTTLKETSDRKLLSFLKRNGKKAEGFREELRKKLAEKETFRMNDEEMKTLSYLQKRFEANDWNMADISNIKDPIYFPRIYNLGKIWKNQKEFADVLMRAYRAEGDQSSEEALRASVNRTIDKLLHVVKADGENKRGQRRFELGREIDIPTYYLNDYIEKDLRVLYGRLVATLEPDIYISKAFGTVSFEKVLGKLEEEKNRKLSEAFGDNERRLKIQKAYQTAAKDMETIWDRVRGEPRALEEKWEGFIRWCKNYNIITKLGKLPLAILYDPFNMQLHVGIGNIGRQTVKLLNAKRLFGKDIENADIWLHSFTATENAHYSDLDNALTAGGKIGRFTGALANTFVKATGAPLVDEWAKRLVGHAKLEYFIRKCQKIAKGEKVGKAVIEDLRKFGIGKEMELRIASEFEKHGKILKGVYVANADIWDEAVGDVLKSAVRKAQNMAILTPTAGSVPRGFDNTFWSTVLQFKRCVFAALSKVAVPFAQEIHDRRIGRVAKCLAAGYIGIYIKELTSDAVTGRERTHEEIEKSVWKSFDALSVGTYLFNVTDLYDTGKSDYMFGEKQVLDALGATGALMTDFWNTGKGIGNVMNGEHFTNFQKKAAKRLIPFNNYLFLEKVVNSLFGIEYREKQRGLSYVAE